MHTMKAVVFRGINDLRLVEVPMFSRQGDGVLKVALFLPRGRIPRLPRSVSKS